MPSPETVSLALIAIGAAAVLRFVWIDSLRFSDALQATGEGRVNDELARRLALESNASRVRTENENLPRAA